MSSVRFFKVPDEFLKTILLFHKAVDHYKDHTDIYTYQKLSERLGEERSNYTQHIEAWIDLLSDVANNYAKLSLFISQIKEYPVTIYGKSLAHVLHYLEQDIKLYQEMTNPSDDEKTLCESLFSLVKNIETDLGKEQSRVANIKLDQSEEQKRSTNTM